VIVHPVDDVLIQSDPLVAYDIITIPLPHACHSQVGQTPHPPPQVFVVQAVAANQLYPQVHHHPVHQAPCVQAHHSLPHHHHQQYVVLTHDIELVYQFHHAPELVEFAFHHAVVPQPHHPILLAAVSGAGWFAHQLFHCHAVQFPQARDVLRFQAPPPLPQFPHTSENHHPYHHHNAVNVLNTEFDQAVLDAPPDHQAPTVTKYGQAVTVKALSSLYQPPPHHQERSHVQPHHHTTNTFTIAIIYSK